MLPAGDGPRPFTPPCWTCAGTNCLLAGTYAQLGPEGTTSNATALFSVPGAGPYRLAYQLENGGGPVNSWRAIISYSSTSVVLDSIYDADPFSRKYTELLFLLPTGVTELTVVLEARQVCTRSFTQGGLLTQLPTEIIFK